MGSPEAPPLVTAKLPLRSATAIPQFAYRKVIVEGEFDYENEIEIGPRTRDGELGYHVITPLKRGDGRDTILVNRGFVRRDRKEQKDRPNSLVSNEAESSSFGLLIAIPP